MATSTIHKRFCIVWPASNKLVEIINLEYSVDSSKNNLLLSLSYCTSYDIKEKALYSNFGGLSSIHFNTAYI